MALNIQWHHLLDDAIHQYIQRSPLQYVGDNNRAARIAFLTDIGITPAMCFGIHQRDAAPAGAAALAAVAPAKVKLADQLSDENIADFLDRAADFMALTGLPNGQQILHLQSAAQPKVKTHISTLRREGMGQYQDIVAALHLEFSTPKFVIGQQFQTAKPHTGETYSSFGQRLLALFMRFMGRPLADFQNMREAVTHALLLKLLDCLPPFAQRQLHLTLRHQPQMTWTNILYEVDTCMATTQQTPTSRTRIKPQATTKRIPNHCTVHPNSPHSNADCFQQQQRSNTPHTASRKSNLKQVTVVTEDVSPPPSELNFEVSHIQSKNANDVLWTPGQQYGPPH